LIHLVDAANPRVMQQVESVERILAQLDLVDIPSLLVLNKRDVLTPEELQAIAAQLSHDGRRDVVSISALKPATLRPLLERVGAILARDLAAENRSLSLTA
jgi:GTP-binding protein HflX